MSELVLDIETQNTFQEVGKYDHSLLRISLVGVYNYETREYAAYLENELPKLWKIMERADRIIGYNIKGFDLPVLNNYYPGDLGRFSVLDIMEVLERVLGFRLKLDDVAKATLGIGKTGTGLMAIQYFRAGEMEKLKEYCLRDVKVTKEIYEFGLKHRQVAYRDHMGKLTPVPVDFNFNPKLKPAINLTIPI